MKQVFWDTNVLLDILLKRDPFFAPAARLWLATESGELGGQVSIPSLTTIFYLVSKSTDRRTASSVLKTVCSVFHVVSSPTAVVRRALDDDWKDFEDGIQYHTAVFAKADCFITRNTRDFSRAQGTRPPVLTPAEFLLTFS